MLIKGRFNKIIVVFTFENINKRLYDPKGEEKNQMKNRTTLSLLKQAESLEIKNSEDSRYNNAKLS